jgi:antitoxin (DNA-binding transcriptional repressor) of toxin-antitoxin stability system
MLVAVFFKRVAQMEPIKVSICDFRNKFAIYLKSRRPITITRHGQIVGHFIPTQVQVRRRRGQYERNVYYWVTRILVRLLIKAFKGLRLAWKKSLEIAKNLAAKY